MKHLCFLKRIVFFTLLTVCASSYAQTVKFIDNKGTLRTLEQGIGNVAEIYDATGGQAFTGNATFLDIIFSTPGIVDSDYLRSSNSITITKSGRYEITYRVSTQVTDNKLNAGEFYLEVNVVVSPGTRGYTYNDNSAVYDSVTVTKIINVTANTVIKVKGKAYFVNQPSNSSLEMATNGSSSLIVKRIK